MGATEVDLTEKWSGNQADLSEVDFSGNRYAVAVTLDVTRLRGDVHFFTVTGKNPDGSTNTTSYGYGYDSFQSATCLVAYEGTPNLGFNFPQKLGLYDADCAYITLVFNYTNSFVTDGNEKIYTSAFNISMLRWDKDGNPNETEPIVHRSGTYKGVTIADQLTMLEIDSNIVKDIALYTDNFSEEESKQIADQMANKHFGKSGDTDSTVPEPTTATLSLLALSALIGRRRRR